MCLELRFFEKARVWSCVLTCLERHIDVFGAAPQSLQVSVRERVKAGKTSD